MAFLRVRSTRELLGYFQALDNINEGIALQRLKEVKYALDEMKKFRGVGNQAIEIDQDMGICIQSHPRERQYCSLKDFTNRHALDRGEEAEHQALTDEEDSLLSKAPRSSSARSKKPSKLSQLLLYSRGYLALVGVLMGGLVLSALFLMMSFNSRLELLETLDTVSEEMSVIQQKYSNLVAYDWLRVLALLVNNSLGPVTPLYSSAISVFMSTDINQRITQAYPADYVNSILYGDVCGFFTNQTFCRQFRSGIFESGWSVLLPMIVKEHIDTNNMSALYTDYFLHLCDSTTVLFNGVIPLTQQIPLQGYAVSLQATELLEIITTSIFIFTLFLLTFITLFCLWSTHLRTTIVREEVLSLDTVSSLYALPSFKPYFNEIYYS
jgi:hypothetical protein